MTPASRGLGAHPGWPWTVPVAIGARRRLERLLHWVADRAGAHTDAAPQAATLRLVLHPTDAAPCRADLGLDSLPVPLSLQVEAVDGSHRIILHDLDPGLTIALPAGSYRVTLREGEVERQHLVRLEVAGRHDLHLTLHHRALADAR